MIHWLYMFMRFFPFIGLALAAAFVQVAIFYRRKGSKVSWLLWFLAFCSLVLVGVWFFFRGYSESDHWVKTFTSIRPT